MPTTTLSTDEAIETSLKYLRDARGFISKGWTQGVFHLQTAGSKHRYCALGGLYHAAGAGYLVNNIGNNIRFAKPTLLAERYLRYGASRVLRKRIDQIDIVLFNDSTRRTKEQVLRAYDFAIAKAEKELEGAR